MKNNLKLIALCAALLVALLAGVWGGYRVRDVEVAELTSTCVLLDAQFALIMNPLDVAYDQAKKVPYGRTQDTQQKNILMGATKTALESLSKAADIWNPKSLKSK
jgi:hypothetical protein